jgi:hypothetical protein
VRLIAAVLLMVAAFLGGLDVLHDKPHATTAAAEHIADGRPSAGGAVEPTHLTAEHAKLGRNRISVLLPSQSHARPARPISAATVSTPTSSGFVTDRHRSRQVVGCSLETLQVFRC